MKLNIDFLDFFDLENENEFIEYFRKINFELKFKDNMNDYIKKIISRIERISDFKILELINFKNVHDKDNLLDIIKKKYDCVMNKENDLFTKNKMNKTIKNISNLIILIFQFEKVENKFDFIHVHIKNLSKDIISLIYIQIIQTLIEKNEFLENKNNDELEEIEENYLDFNELKIFIFNEFIDNFNKKNDINNILTLLNCLDEKLKNEQKDGEKNINEFLQKLVKKQLFTKEEFFSTKKNIKLELIYRLYEKGKIRKNNIEYFDNILELLKSIKKDIDGNIKYKTLERFLKNDESIIKKRLSLIQLITNEEFNPNNEFELLKKKKAEINKDLEELSNIKYYLSIYHKNIYEDIIKKILLAIKNSSDLDIIKINKQNKELINECNKFKNLIEKIKKVKKFLLFNEIYKKAEGKNEENKFNYAYNKIEEIGKILTNKKNINEFYEKYKEVINKIIEKFSYKNKNIQEFIDQIIEYYNINNITNKDLIDNITSFFQNKKSEYDKKKEDYCK